MEVDVSEARSRKSWVSSERSGSWSASMCVVFEGLLVVVVVVEEKEGEERGFSSSESAMVPN